MKILKLIGALVVILVGIGVIVGNDKTDRASSSDNTPAAAAATSHANVYVVASRSRCWYTGVDDPYTGDGHVGFYVTVHNSGQTDGSINVTPARFYSDGEENRSAMNMVTIDVPAGETRGGRLDLDTYEAHRHEIESCALEANGTDAAIRADYIGG